MHVTGTMLPTLAEREAISGGVLGFKVSEGWLSKVKVRRGISGRALCGDTTGRKSGHPELGAGFASPLSIL